ncbi:RagB/SusD family nutrient uptake outer membrane protein [Chitinophaga sp.]|uniref:RagB/SusD family nutrient uptake outer membrane protein n=1 Tax=Chitinophaga sp. TaxID=1869181 RepID=UPI002614AAFB|nr:RagB/SusD family nutrient uptake outer membrane protein [uncultured Chitinophaga sp.]
MKRSLRYFIGLAATLTLGGCGGDFLDVKQLKSLQVPHTIADFQAILDYNFVPGSSPHTLATNGSDEYLITEQRYTQLASETNAYLRDVYTWSPKINMLQYEQNTDWSSAYVAIFYANHALSGIDGIVPAPGEQAAWNNVKGTAHFFRAFQYYNLAQQFAFPYDKTDNPNGLPLRLEPDVTMKIKRSTVHQTYQQILDDALKAAELLPSDNKRTNYIRPGKVAALALAAKIYLHMGEYAKAAEYADRCLAIRGDLIDFNTLGADDPVNFYEYAFAADYGATNPEVYYYAVGDNGYSTALYSLFKDRSAFNPDLLDLYEPGDIRSKVYFRPYIDVDGFRFLVFKGSYAAYSLFTGLAADELYLLRAECHARTGSIDKSLADLNHLLQNRIATASYSPVTERDPDKLLEKILLERRKEMVFRGTRWEDLRRLNKEPQFAQTLVREIGGKRHELLPNDPRYTWPLPQTEIDAGGLTQNPR